MIKAEDIIRIRQYESVLPGTELKKMYEECFNEFEENINKNVKYF